VSLSCEQATKMMGAATGLHADNASRQFCDQVDIGEPDIALIGTAWSPAGKLSRFSDLARHLGIRPVSQLNTRPVVSPVNASRRPSRDAAHHSGSGRLARPYSVKDFHLLFFASFPGALAVGLSSTF
jgi:hypothetical protein